MASAFIAAAALLLAVSAGAGKCQLPLAAENLLLQTTELKLQARAARKLPTLLQLVQADGQIAQYLQERRAEPHQIAATLQAGLAAVMQAVKHFMAQPPEVEKGLDVLGKQLLEAISAPVMQHMQQYNSSAYQAFELEWMNFFDNAASTVPSVQGNITLFQEEGHPDALIMAISDILMALSLGVVAFVPHETAQEVVKYVYAVGDLLGAVGASWVGFESGQEAQAIEDLYFALKAALSQVLSENLQNDETYKIIIGTLDAVIGNLSETVLGFQKQIVEGAVCWKAQEAKKKKSPSVCPEGFYWNGAQFCLPVPSQESATLLQTRRAVAAGGLEGTALRKVDYSTGGKQPIPDGAMVALCEETGNYTEKVGHWCYAACPNGMASVGLQCKTQCQGEFPADDGAMLCGQSPGAIAEAIMNMVMAVTNGAINSGLLIATMATDGVGTDSLVNTIQAFVNMGKPFAYKTCPSPSY